MLRQAGVADNREDALHVRVQQTLAQDALPNHACRSEENHFHLTVSDLSPRRIPKRSGGTLHFSSSSSRSKTTGTAISGVVQSALCINRSASDDPSIHLARTVPFTSAKKIVRWRQFW